jgi:hypothetical protein
MVARRNHHKFTCTDHNVKLICNQDTLINRPSTLDICENEPDEWELENLV